MGVDLAEQDQDPQCSDTLRRNVLMGAPCPVLFVPTLHSTEQMNVDESDTHELNPCVLSSSSR